MSKRLSQAEIRRELLKRVYKALDGLVTNEGARERLRAVAAKTYFVTVPNRDYVSRGIGVRTEGENIQEMYVVPGFFKMVRRAYLVIPEGKFNDLAYLNSRNPDERRVAEESMEVITHEAAHTFLNSIDYERNRAIHYIQNPDLMTRKMARQILAAGVIKDNREAIKKAREVIDTRPIFAAGYIAHAEHEAAADIVGTNLVARLIEGRRPKVGELIRFTWRRPAPVREILMEHLRTIPRARERKSFIERAAGLWEIGSKRIYDSLGSVVDMKEMKHPERELAFAHSYGRRHR